MAMRYAMTRGFRCACQLVPPSEGVGGGVVISAPVGDAAPWRCPNRPEDVRAIQKALNRFPPLDGGPQRPLAADGLCGPLTRAAIRHFQRKWGIQFQGKDVADGIVDREGPTIQQLRKGPGGPATPDAQFARHLPRLIEVLTAARAALNMARYHYVGASQLGFGEVAAAKFNRHFHADKIAHPLGHLREVERIFLAMLTAVGHVPQGIVVMLDEPPQIAQGAFMFTFAGGYDIRARGDTWHAIHRGSIYLCPLSRMMSRDGFVYATIHELAHYVGPPHPNDIGDHAYFDKPKPRRYRSLSAAQALRNADSYAQFAFEAVGRSDYDPRLEVF